MTSKWPRPYRARTRNAAVDLFTVALMTTTAHDRIDANAGGAAPADELRPVSYWPFVLPALIVVLAVIVFPWVFTIWMSLHEWKVGAPTTFVGLANYWRMPRDPRFVEAVWHTLVYTALSVVLPLVFGTLAAVVVYQKISLRRGPRGLFIIPMIATPGPVAPILNLMFHPPLRVLH